MNNNITPHSKLCDHHSLGKGRAGNVYKELSGVGGSAEGRTLTVAASLHGVGDGGKPDMPTNRPPRRKQNQAWGSVDSFWPHRVPGTGAESPVRRASAILTAQSAASRRPGRKLPHRDKRDAQEPGPPAAVEGGERARWAARLGSSEAASSTWCGSARLAALWPHSRFSQSPEVTSAGAGPGSGGGAEPRSAAGRAPAGARADSPWLSGRPQKAAGCT